MHDYQSEYHSLPSKKKDEFLELVSKTKEDVMTMIDDILSSDLLIDGIKSLRSNISTKINDFMMYIAENDVIGFSDNSGTDLRHALLGLGKSVDGILTMINTGMGFDKDSIYRQLNQTEIHDISRMILRKKLQVLQQLVIK